MKQNSASLLALDALTIEAAPEPARRFLQEARDRMGFVPNMYSLMANSPGLLETYIRGQALFRQGSGFSPAEQEVVLLTVSRENQCDYCMAAHSVIADAVSKVPPEVTEAIREDRNIAEPRLAALGAFTRSMLRSRGFAKRADLDAFLAAGFTERHVLEVILAIAVKTISNYANHLFGTPLDHQFAGHEWRRAGVTAEE